MGMNDPNADYLRLMLGHHGILSAAPEPQFSAVA
jgi:hypothetical protein